MRVGIVSIREPRVSDLYAVLSSGSHSALIALGVRWHDRILLRLSPGKTLNRVAQFFLDSIRADSSASAPSRGPQDPIKHLTEAIASVSWHYKIPYDAVLAMPVKAFSLYANRIERFRGLDLLSAAAVASLPYMKPSDRRKQLRTWTSMVKPGARLNGSLGLMDLLKQAGKIQ